MNLGQHHLEICDPEKNKRREKKEQENNAPLEAVQIPHNHIWIITGLPPPS